MFRILHLITGLEPGGAQTFLGRLLKRSNGELFENLVVSMKDGGAYSDRILETGTRLRTMGMRGTGDILRGAYNLRRILGEERPHLISAWMYHANAASVLGRYLGWRGPIVWNIRHSLHGIEHEPGHTARAIRLGRMMSARANAIVYNSMKSARQHEEFGFCSSNSKCIPNGFDCSKYRPNGDCRSRLIRELGLRDDSLIVGHAGRYHRMKDHRTMLMAASMLAKKHENVHFVFCGAGVDESSGELAEYIDRCGLGGRVSLLGERGDMKDIYPAMDIFVSSSCYGEGFSNVVAEAMSCGVPCVVTDVGESASIVDGTGRVVSPGDSKELAHAMERIAEMSLEKRTDLGLMARGKIASRYSIERAIESHEAVYRDLIDNKVTTA